MSMITYTQNNYLRFGYDSVDFASKKLGTTIHFESSRCTRAIGTFKEECVNVARLLSAEAERLGRDVVIMLSGGLDSEVVVKSFLNAQLPFRVMTWRLANGLNAHEVSNAQRFADRHGLQLEFYDFDVDTFLKTEAEILFRESHCAWGIMTLHMKVMSHIQSTGGFSILGGLPPQITNINGKWYFEQYEYVTAWFWHNQSHGIESGVAFFQYTPEITLAMLESDRFKRLTMSPIAAKIVNDSVLVKYEVYRDHWPDLERRPKYTGAELIRPRMRALEKECLAELSYDGHWLCPYKEFCDSITFKG